MSKSCVLRKAQQVTQKLIPAFVHSLIRTKSYSRTACMRFSDALGVIVCHSIGEDKEEGCHMYGTSPPSRSCEMRKYTHEVLRLIPW
jgi:hypothetical protein